MKSIYIYIRVSVCLAVGMEGVVFPVLRLLVSDAGGQVMRWSGHFTAESVCYSVRTEHSFGLAPQNSSNCQRRCWHDMSFPFIFIYCFLFSQTENEYRGKLLNQRWTRGDKISRCRPSLRLQSRPIKVSCTSPSANRHAETWASCQVGTIKGEKGIYIYDIRQFCLSAHYERKSALYYRDVRSSCQLDLEWVLAEQPNPPLNELRF